ncbi:MAG: hypothetical protein NDF56_08150 [archaeon GB-1845-036]|nr:hypothetical protein [Candidatus Culexmicrobium thermophilum]RLE54398.1 MAG: hypothetical protein DRJ30_05240 [Candidatus Verstraetearchaeota archaeon]
MRGQIFTVDAVAASTLMMTVLINLFLISQMSILVKYEAPESLLGILLKDEEFIYAVYSLDSGRLRAILNSYLGLTPYNLTLLDADGGKLLSIGVEVEGLAASTIIVGVNGTVNPIIICLKVRQP